MELVDRNVNSVWPQALRYLRDEGKARESRNGPVMEAAEPVLTRYDRPEERVLFDPIRDANPFLHLFETLWILAGRDDVAWPSQFAARLKDYSDNGVTFHGAYGRRLRYSPMGDQLARAVQLLANDPASRRVVLTLWNPVLDLGKDSKDLPCNTQLYVKVRDGALHMTVCNRSNDIVWGLYGANVVQWSMLQEYLASKLGLACGPLTTLSDSFHAYADNPTWQYYKSQRQIGGGHCPYEAGLVRAWPLMDVPATFDKELERFLADELGELSDMFPKRQPCKNSFFWAVAEPMFAAWRAHKASGTGAKMLEETIHERTGKQIDWLAAGHAWLERRERKHAHRPARPTPRARDAGRRGSRARPSQVRR